MNGRRLALVVGIVLAAGFAPIAASPARAWNDATGELDMPWLGGGERARLFTETTTCVMGPTGSQFHRRWGRSGSAGSDPYDDVDAALRFLAKKGVLDAWPQAIAEGSVADGKELIEPRATPYRLLVVMLEPMVVVMRFDLGALVKLGGGDADQAVGSPRLNQSVAFGTRFPATGHLLWFSPTADQAPTPVTMLAPDRGEIIAAGTRLVLHREGDGWVVAAPERASGGRAAASGERPAAQKRGWFW